MSSYLITGAGRGIGLELVKQLAALDDTKVSTVFATTRGSPSKELNDVIQASNGRVVNVVCEVTKQASVNAAAKEVETKLAGRGLDVLVNNVGIMPLATGGIASMTGEQLAEVFDTNVISAQRVTSALLPLLRKGGEKKIVNISSTVGSIAYARRYVGAPAPPVYSYKVSKAAMSMLGVQYAIELEPEGFTVLMISPGWLKTDMGSQYADLDVDRGVQAVLEVMLNADKSKNGKFLNIHVPGWEHAEGSNQYDGSEVPW